LTLQTPDLNALLQKLGKTIKSTCQFLPELRFSSKWSITNSAPSSTTKSLETAFQQSEQIVGFIIVNKLKRFGKSVYFTGIFAPMNKEMLKEVTRYV